MWGFSGIGKMAALMEDAYKNAKDTRDLVPRKAWAARAFCSDAYNKTIF
jgi:hypothetical protein